MKDKTPSDFHNHDEWLSYVRENIPVTGQPYALACGRTELFRSFCALREQTFPTEFAVELERLRALREPERTNKVESLNQRILASLTEFLFDKAQAKANVADAIIPISPAKQVQHLLDHLTEKNPYFALWTVFKSGIGGNFDAQGWEDYLRGGFGPESEDDIAFTYAMVELDKLLLYFLDRNLPLPKYFFERCWFLHYLRGPERMLQTRALLNTLTAETEACASA
ncbi:MAG: hypothetical protein WA419_16655 [Silvibacterium sp.]